ncbi:hypothetical protein D3C76_1560600 [compost metagenome]
MGRLHQRLCIGVLQAWQVDVQVDIQAKAAWDLANADPRSDRGVGWNAAFALAGDELQCTDEAGRVTSGEQLLRVGGITTSTTQFLRTGQFHVEVVVAGDGSAITTTGCGRDCGVENFHGFPHF